MRHVSTKGASIRERNYAIPFIVEVCRSAQCVLVFLGEERQSEHFQGMWDLFNMLNVAVERAGAKLLWQHNPISNCSIPLDIDILDNPKDPSILNTPGTILNLVTSTTACGNSTTARPLPPGLRAIGRACSVGNPHRLGAIAELGDDAAKQIALSTPGDGVTIEEYPNGSSLIQALRRSAHLPAGQQDMVCPRRAHEPGRRRTADLQTLAHFAARWARGCDPENGVDPRAVGGYRYI
ncbi:hypothetical protein F5X96DRAFT_692822 [Biscogniauxia mediterranea]|nr:hypothetical protein F5X96DRAFT_692822 [Biscogniauxia mediterranea]